MIALESNRFFCDKRHGKEQCCFCSYPSGWNSESYRSYVDFVVSFLATRPLDHEPVEQNLAVLFNRVGDEVMIQRGLDINGPARAFLMRDLCREFFETHGWPYEKSCFPAHLDREWRCIDGSDTLAFNVVLANVALENYGLPEVVQQLDLRSTASLRSSAFGTLFGVAVKSGRADLVAHTLEEGIVDLNRRHYNALEMAIQRDQPDMLELLFSEEYGLHRHGPRIIECTCRAIEIGRVACALFLLGIGEYEGRVWDLGGVFTTACEHGCLEVLRALEHLGIDPVEEARESNIVERAAWFGQWQVLEYFFSKDVKPNPLSLRAAAMNGDVAMAKFLVAAGAQPEPGTWCKILLLAAAHHNYEFTQSILEEGIVSVRTLLEDKEKARNLLLYAHILGDVHTVNALVSAGMSQGRANRLGRLPMFRAMVAWELRDIDDMIDTGFSSLYFVTFQDCNGREFSSSFPKRKNRAGNVANWKYRYCAAVFNE
ncbi:hypothetical protein F5Y05DRAFT_373536 [Hypoxylon sp. FL0543]|nr:hypothetical protein F5Y05DRAFT_373536 [Hypoxylon sp. FL0543]